MVVSREEWHAAQLELEAGVLHLKLVTAATTTATTSSSAASPLAVLALLSTTSTTTTKIFISYVIAVLVECRKRGMHGTTLVTVVVLDAPRLLRCDVHALKVEPVLTLIATNVRTVIVIRLLTQTEQLTRSIVIILLTVTLTVVAVTAVTAMVRLPQHALATSLKCALLGTLLRELGFKLVLKLLNNAFETIADFALNVGVLSLLLTHFA